MSLLKSMNSILLAPTKWLREALVPCTYCAKHGRNRHIEACKHLSRKGMPEINTQRNMHKVAHEKRCFSVEWAVVHPQHAGFPKLFPNKKEAEKYRREHATMYAVCKVAVTPLYEEGNFKGLSKY